VRRIFVVKVVGKNSRAAMNELPSGDPDLLIRIMSYPLFEFEEKGLVV